MFKYKPFLFILGFLFGCAVATIVIKPELFWAVAIFILGGLFFRLLFKCFDRDNYSDFVVAVIMFFIGLFFGVLRVVLNEINYHIAVNEILPVSERKFVACIVDPPEFVNGKQKVVVRVDGLGDVLLKLPLYPAYKYGDELSVVASINRAEKFDNFDYEEYLKMKGIVGISNDAYVSLNGYCGNVFLKTIYAWRNYFLVRLNSQYPEPFASFVAGILIGERSSIPEEINSMFTRIGVTHVVAISGYNISIIIASVSLMFGFLSRKKKVVASVIFVFVFVVFVGAGSSVVRAGIMGILNLIGVYFGRGIVFPYAVSVAAFFMALWSPKILIYDVSFQLSFLATIGIVYLSPLIKNFLKFINLKIIQENLAVTLAAQIFTIPIILKNFGFVSWIAPFSNIAVLPFIPLSMLLSFVGLVFKPVAFLNYVLLEILFFVMRFFDFFVTL